MNIVTRWAKLLAAGAGAAFASRLWRKRANEKEAHKAELNEWENEGGNLAPAPEAPNTVLTSGSA
jgi:hypothetical protein